MTLSVLAGCGGALAGGWVDARTGFIPDGITRTAGIAAAVAAFTAGTALWAFDGALAAGGSLAMLYVLTRGRGLGLGDVKLATAIGAGFGPLTGITAVAAAFVLGGTYACWLLLRGRAERGDAIRFGPFLAAGAVLAAIGCTVSSR